MTYTHTINLKFDDEFENTYNNNYTDRLELNKTENENRCQASFFDLLMARTPR